MVTRIRKIRERKRISLEQMPALTGLSWEECLGVEENPLRVPLSFLYRYLDSLCVAGIEAQDLLSDMEILAQGIEQLHPIQLEDQKIYDEIRTLLGQLARLLFRSAGIKATVTSYSPFLKRGFLSLPQPQRKDALEDLERYFNLLQRALKEGGDLRDNGRLMELFLEEAELEGDRELLREATEADCLEIYRPNCIQSFRTVNFFELSGHSLEDLTLRPFWDLFAKDEQMEKLQAEATHSLLKGESVDWPELMRPVLVTEINSRRPIASVCQTKNILPLRPRLGGSGVPSFLHAFNVLSQKRAMVPPVCEPNF